MTRFPQIPWAVYCWTREQIETHSNILSTVEYVKHYNSKNSVINIKLLLFLKKFFWYPQAIQDLNVFFF